MSKKGIFNSEKCSKYDDFAPCFIYGVKWRKAVVVVVDDDDVGHTMSALLKYHQPYVDEEDLRPTLSYNDKWVFVHYRRYKALKPHLLWHARHDPGRHGTGSVETIDVAGGRNLVVVMWNHQPRKS